jgi:Zn finger protein HypA/HybF involved in hydrogenase expression
MQEFEKYEKLAVAILRDLKSHFGLTQVEDKQHVKGQESGTTWEIDGKGVMVDGEAFVIIECRCYLSSRPNQEALGALAYRIRDTGASGGIIVTPLGIQEGAKRVARAANVVSVRLDPSNTTSDYIVNFLNRVIAGASMELGATYHMAVSAEAIRQCRNCSHQYSPSAAETTCPECGQ